MVILLICQTNSADFRDATRESYVCVFRCGSVRFISYLVRYKLWVCLIHQLVSQIQIVGLLDPLVSQLVRFNCGSVRSISQLVRFKLWVCQIHYLVSQICQIQIVGLLDSLVSQICQIQIVGLLDSLVSQIYQLVSQI